MKFREMRDAVADADITKRLFEDQCTELGELLAGNLRNINSWNSQDVLSRLKKELTQYNAATGKWKN